MRLSSEASTITVNECHPHCLGCSRTQSTARAKGGTPAASGPRCFYRASPPRWQPRSSLPVRSARSPRSRAADANQGPPTLGV
jgi:hypothetical protein